MHIKTNIKQSLCDKYLTINVGALGFYVNVSELCFWTYVEIIYFYLESSTFIVPVLLLLRLLLTRLCSLETPCSKHFAIDGSISSLLAAEAYL